MINHANLVIPKGMQQCAQILFQLPWGAKILIRNETVASKEYKKPFENIFHVGGQIARNRAITYKGLTVTEFVTIGSPPTLEGL